MDDKAEQRDVITISSSIRQRRVCFLINPHKTTSDELDQIISYSVTRWGGRFHGIFPTDGDSVPAEWWKALVAVDPDVIYALTPISPTLIWKINRYICPMRIYSLDDQARQRFPDHLINGDEMRAVGIAGLPRFVAKHPQWGTERNFAIPVINGPIKDKSIALRNAGIVHLDAGLSDAFKGLSHTLIECDGITDLMILNNVLAAGSNSITPLELCRSMCPRNYAMRHDAFVDGFHLVIGDSPFDALYYWNRGLVEEGRSTGASFWLPEKCMADEGWIEFVAKWCQTFFSPIEQARHGKVVSYSIQTDLLSEIAKKLSASSHLYFEPVSLKQEQFPFPKSDYLPRFSPPQIDQVALSENKAIIGITMPPFLTDVRSDWGYMIDLNIQHRPELYSRTNLRPHWELPKRIGLADLFLGSPRPGRIIEGGLPSAFVVQTDQTIAVQIPPDDTLVWTLFRNDLRNYPTKEKITEPRFHLHGTSAEGQALRGVIRLLGGLDVCHSLFSNHFWRESLIEMSGKILNGPENRAETFRAAISDYMKNAPMTLNPGSEELLDFARFLNERVVPSESLPGALTKEQLSGRFSRMKGLAIQADPRTAAWWTAQSFSDISIQELTEMAVLQQGLYLTCTTCGSKYWYPIHALKSKIGCQGCLNDIDMKIDAVWSFRVNDLLQNALKYRGVLAVVQLLSELNHFKSSMFMYRPSFNIQKGREETIFTDLDVLAFHAGKLLIAEVKSSPEGFREGDVLKVEELAKELQPHRIIFAAPGEKWPKNVLDMFSAARDRLKHLDIEIKPQLLTWK